MAAAKPELINDFFVQAIADAVVERLKETGMLGKSTPKLMTMKEAGAYMGGKTSSAVRHMVMMGVIPAKAVRKLSERRILLDKQELDKWLSAQ